MWSDVKDDTICGSCYVLAENMYTHATCSNYCAAQGLNCTAAFEESSNSCAQAFPATCDYDFASYGTSDALCECTKPGGTPAPTPQQYCDESTWSDVKDGIVCADCYVLAENMYSHATCAAYCAAQGLSCVDAYEESSNSCVENFNAGCNFDFASYGTSDALCRCSGVPGITSTPTPAPTSAPTTAQPTPSPTIGLFFSQFQEASSGNNKYFQIYNATGADIAAGGTYTICNSGLEGNTSSCDEVLNDYLVYFNGDDFISLIAGTDYTTATSADIVDQIGLFSATDPGSYWPVCGSSSGMDTRNGLLTRASNTCSGDSTGAAFEDSFNGDCEWTETDQVTTPAAWTGSCLAPTMAPTITQYCSVSTWSDVKDDTICGSCYVLAENMYTHATCSNYCAAQGLNCTAAFEESSNSCAQAFPATCDYDFASFGTSDALCECTKPGGTPAPTPQQYCDESTWSDVKDGIVCADCYVLAENMYSHA